MSGQDPLKPSKGIVHDDQPLGYIRERDEFVTYLRGPDKILTPFDIQKPWSKARTERDIEPHVGKDINLPTSSLQPDASSKSQTENIPISKSNSASEKYVVRGKCPELDNFDIKHVGDWAKQETKKP